MNLIHHIRALVTGTVLAASTVVMAGPAWSTPAGPVPPAAPSAAALRAADGATSTDEPDAEWVWPLRPKPPVVNGFDPPDKPWGSGHRGVDLLGSDRQRVRSAGTGEVTYAGTLAGRGVIAVTHDGVKTTYEPVEPGVQIGDQVAAGDVIGRLQTAASHCAPRTCLHWGAVRGSTYVDPLGLLGAPGSIRLLPTNATSPTHPFAVPTSPAVSTSSVAPTSSASSSSPAVLASSAVPDALDLPTGLAGSTSSGVPTDRSVLIGSEDGRAPSVQRAPADNAMDVLVTVVQATARVTITSVLHDLTAIEP